MSLVANPSHLEAADPVVLGKTRAIQTLNNDLKDHCAALPVLTHGDAVLSEAEGGSCYTVRNTPSPGALG
ncbi:hypothetical protein U1701_18330 [Sphingomonas sp. PB2P19]|uniref:hypothetical protein n=1 Tax=Sphingomonas rhamnosi TaxID=3096156 RepID=UPI002FC7B594